MKNYLESVVKNVFDLNPLKKYVLGLSGGVDSVVLFYLMVKFNVDFKAIYVHHGLSDNADCWASFCHDLCKENNIQYIQKNVSVKCKSRQSLENQARIARYNAYKDVMSLDDTLVLGHHADDLAESMLLNLFNRAGVSGLSTLPYSYFNDEYGINVLRPFLSPESLNKNPIDKLMIESYAKEQGIENIFDESNLSSNYSRNYLRNEIIPSLKERFGNILKPMSKTNLEAQEIEKLNQDVDLFCVKEVFDGFFKIELKNAVDECEISLIMKKALNRVLRNINFNVSLNDCHNILSALKNKKGSYKLKFKDMVLFIFKGFIYIVDVNNLFVNVIDKKLNVLSFYELNNSGLSLSKFLKSEDSLRKKIPVPLREYCTYVVSDGLIKSLYNSHGNYFLNNKIMDYFINN